MTVNELINLLKKVLVSPEVIGVTIVVILYIAIVNYVVNYRKRVPVPKVKKKKAEKPVTAEAEPAEEEGASARASKRGKKDSTPSEDDEEGGK